MDAITGLRLLPSCSLRMEKIVSAQQLDTIHALLHSASGFCHVSDWETHVSYESPDRIMEYVQDTDSSNRVCMRDQKFWCVPVKSYDWKGESILCFYEAGKEPYISFQGMTTRISWQKSFTLDRGNGVSFVFVTRRSWEGNSPHDAKTTGIYSDKLIMSLQWTPQGFDHLQEPGAFAHHIDRLHCKFIDLLRRV